MYTMEASFLEIYQEQVRDLLCAPEERDGHQYKITQGENGRHDVSDVRMYAIKSQEDVGQVRFHNIVCASEGRDVPRCKKALARTGAQDAWYIYFLMSKT